MTMVRLQSRTWPQQTRSITWKRIRPSTRALKSILMVAVGMHRASAATAFAAGNHPVDAAQAFEIIDASRALKRVVVIDPASPAEGDWAEEWFHREKSHGRRHGKQFGDVAIRFFLIDDRGTQPYVIGQAGLFDTFKVEAILRRLGNHRRYIADALGEQKPIEIGRLLDKVEQVGSLLRIHGVVEYVGERHAEDTATPAVFREKRFMCRIPRQRLAPIRFRCATTGAPGPQLMAGPP